MNAKDVLEKMLNLTYGTGEQVDLDSVKEIESATGQKMTAREAILMAQVKRAIEKGDKSSAEFIFKLTGEFEDTNKTELEVKNPFAGMTTEELRKLAGIEEGC